MDSMLASDNLVYFGELSPPVRRGIEKLYARHSWYATQPIVGCWEDIEGKVWLTVEQICVMFFRLRAAEDEPAIFPGGKWSTIHKLEAMIIKATAGKDKGRAVGEE